MNSAKDFRRYLLVLATLLGLLAPCGSNAAESDRDAPGDDLVSKELRHELTLYLADLHQWIMGLDVGSGQLKNTKDVTTSIWMNGNLTRVLLASRRTTGNQEHLAEALRWCDHLCASQELTMTTRGEQGGCWGDFGRGRNLYFGDAGTACTALAIAYRSADDERKATYLAAMENMARLIIDGSPDDPQGLGRPAPSTWIVREGPDKGALGCGYYRGHLSTEPYIISTATSGGAFFSLLHATTEKPEYRDVALGATRWILKQRRENGEFPYLIDGTELKIWPLDTAAYCTEAFVASDTHLHDAELRQELTRELRPTIDWLLEIQNADGTWGKLRSQDQQRSPGVVTLLAWYYRTLDRDPRVAEAVQKYCRYLLDPANSRAYGAKELVRTTGFIGLALSEIVEPGSTF